VIHTDGIKQVSELLNEVKPSTQKAAAVKHFVEKLKSLLLRMKKGKCEHQVPFYLLLLLFTLYLMTLHCNISSYVNACGL